MTRQITRTLGIAAVASVTLLALTVDVRTAPPGAGGEQGAITVQVVPQANALFLSDVFKKIDTSIKGLWEKFKKNVLQKFFDFIKKPVENAKNKIKGIIDKAKNGLLKLLENKVILTAIAFVLPKVIPGFDKITKFVQQVIGKVERLTEMAQKYAGVVDAWIQGKKDVFQKAVGEASSTMDIIQKLDAQAVVKIVIELLKDKLLPFVKSKTIDLLGAVFDLVEKPLQIARTAIASALGSIPFVGWALSGAVDVAINLALKWIRSKGLEFVGNKAAELAGKLIDKVGNWLASKAAKLDANPKFQSVLSKIKGFIAKAASMMAPIKAAFDKVKGVMKILTSKPSFGDVMAVGLEEIGKKLYNTALDWLAKNKGTAEKKLGDLVSKIPLLGKTFKDIVVGGFNEGGATFIAEARTCGNTHISGGDLKKIATGLLGCLKDAALKGAKAAGVGAVRGAWDAFVNLLSKSCDKAVGKLGEFASKLTSLIKPAAALVNPALDALRSGCQGAVDKVAAANPVQ